MHASKLLQGVNLDETELPTMELFISAAFSADVSGKVKVSSATAQLEGLLAGKTALRGGAGWAEGKAMGIVSGFDAWLLVLVLEVRSPAGVRMTWT